MIKGKKKMYRLKKALYRLKQALKAWYNQIYGYFDENSFLKSKSEPTLNVKKARCEWCPYCYFVC